MRSLTRSSWRLTVVSFAAAVSAIHWQPKVNYASIEINGMEPARKPGIERTVEAAVDFTPVSGMGCLGSALAFTPWPAPDNPL
jgi:hypothetical protein